MTFTFVDGDNVVSVSLAPEEPEKSDVPEVEVDAETVTLVLDSVALVEMKDERDDEDEPADEEDVRTDGEGVRIDDDEDVRDDEEDVRTDEELLQVSFFGCSAGMFASFVAGFSKSILWFG
ncbi:hypothetical protein D6D05_01838 [Aureobasidium pullulans]|nr:hypothetical protein D6D05_01838 [Aureobasidium pullulans]